jgi:hypothetical protein
MRHVRILITGLGSNALCILTRPVPVCGMSAPVHRRGKRSVPHCSRAASITPSYPCLRTLVMLSKDLAEPCDRGQLAKTRRESSSRSTQSNSRATSSPPWRRRACCLLSCLGKRVIGKAVDIAVEPVGAHIREQPLWVLLRQIVQSRSHALAHTFQAVEGSHCSQYRCRASRVACLQRMPPASFPAHGQNRFEDEVLSHGYR